MQNLYELLGIKKNANLNTIRKAFRRKALIFHPDTNKNPDATEKFREIVNAYEVLSDPQQRGEYDKTLFVSTTPKAQETKKEKEKQPPKRDPKKQKTYSNYSTSTNNYRSQKTEVEWTKEMLEQLDLSNRQWKYALSLICAVAGLTSILFFLSRYNSPQGGRRSFESVKELADKYKLKVPLFTSECSAASKIYYKAAAKAAKDNEINGHEEFMADPLFGGVRVYAYWNCYGHKDWPPALF